MVLQSAIFYQWFMKYVKVCSKQLFVKERAQNMLQGILQYAHSLLTESIKSNETVIDATCGNGHDTLLLSTLVGNAGHVLAFDVQEQAIQNTRKLLADNNLTNVSYVHDSHAEIEHYLKKHAIDSIGGAVFNLGYLPKSDKSVITEGPSTIQAIDTLLSYLKKQGLIVIVVYHGHDGGKTEKNMVLEHVQQLDQKKYHVLQYGFINQKNHPPFIIAIEKRVGI